MRRNRFQVVLAVAAVATAIVGSIVSSANPDVVTVSAYTGSNNKDNYGGNMSDLFSGEEMTKTDPDDPSTWTTVAPDHYSHEWQTAGLLSGAANGKIAWAALDFGSTVSNLESAYFWNIREATAQNRRTVNYNIYYADSPTVALPAAPTGNTSVDYDFAGGGWTSLTSTPLTMPQRGASPDPADQVVALGGISARYIGLEILSNAGGTRAGLSEVAVTQGAGGGPGPEPLLIDFNSTNQDGGPHNQSGYQAYDARHEVAADFVTKTYSAFGTTVSVTPAWPNTTDNRVQQMIDRGSGNDNNWNNADGDIDLVTDWLGIDTRTGGGGNGNWDGTTGTPTYMTLTLGGLPAGAYDWKSFHHDTENVHGDFVVDISTDGGATWEALPNGLMTDSTPGGSPGSEGFTPPGPWPGPDADLLPSTYETSFTADGLNDVILRFAPLSNTGVHRQLWGINGFELTQAVPEPSTFVLAALGLLGLGWFGRRRRRRS